MNSMHLHYKDQPVNAVQVGEKYYCKDHTQTHKHTMRANAVADGTHSCNWDSEIQLFVPYHHDMFTKMNKFWNKSCEHNAMKHFQHKRSSEVIDEHGFGFHVTLDSFELKLNPSAYISCTPQTLQFNRHCFWIFLRKNKLKNITNSTLLLFKEKHAAVRQLALVRRIGQVPGSGLGSKMSNPDGGLFVNVSMTPTISLKFLPHPFLIHYLIAMLASEILVKWHKIKLNYIKPARN